MLPRLGQPEVCYLEPVRGVHQDVGALHTTQPSGCAHLHNHRQTCATVGFRGQLTAAITAVLMLSISLHLVGTYAGLGWPRRLPPNCKQSA